MKQNFKLFSEPFGYVNGALVRGSPALNVRDRAARRKKLLEEQRKRGMPRRAGA